MPSARIKKKQLKGKMRANLAQNLSELNTLNLQIDEVDAEIKKLKTILKSKKVTLSQLQQAVMQSSMLSEKSIDKIAMDVHKTSLGYNSDKDHATHYAAIKKYHDYVDRGIIKKQSSLDKYELADFMERIMTESEYEDYLNEANKKADELIAKSKARASITPADRWGF